MTEPEAPAEKRPHPDEVLWSVALVLVGPTLDPDAVSRTLGVPPTRSWRKGDRHTTSRGNVIIRKAGLWRLSSHDTAERGEEGPGRIGERIAGLLSRVPFRGNIREAVPDLERCRVAIFYGGPMKDEDAGDAEFLIDPLVAEELGRRGLELYLEVFLDRRDTDPAAGEPSQKS